MLTIGVDLAAADARTALAAIDWSPGRARVADLRVGVPDERIVDAITSADKAGLDCPLGWPEPFVEFLVAHRQGRVPAPAEGSDGAAWRRSLTYRTTDELVRAQTGVPPLSVAADRIGHVALRCAALLAQLAERGTPVDRCGDGVVVEVYPAAALHRWGLTHRGYKRPGRRDSHGLLVDGLLAAARWLELGAYEPLCRSTHDATDAVVAALVARAAALGLATRPDADQRDQARTEGWIAVPTGALTDLVEPA
ncbi:MAG TPA: DUF429 domain-containing protein [Micromonosporaceae bacterium]